MTLLENPKIMARLCKLLLHSIKFSLSHCRSGQGCTKILLRRSQSQARLIRRLSLVMVGGVCKHVLESVGFGQEETHFLVSPVDGWEVLQKHQEALKERHIMCLHRHRSGQKTQRGGKLGLPG